MLDPILQLSFAHVDDRGQSETGSLSHVDSRAFDVTLRSKLKQANKSRHPTSLGITKKLWKRWSFFSCFKILCKLPKVFNMTMYSTTSRNTGTLRNGILSGFEHCWNL